MTADRGAKIVRHARRLLSDPVSGGVLRASAVSMSVRTAGLAIAFLSHMLISRTLGASAYGQYSIALGWALILVIPARLGVDNTVLRYASIYLEEENFAALRALIRFALVMMVLSSSVVAIVLIGQAQLGSGLFSMFSSGAVLWIGALIFTLAALGLYSALIRSAKRVLASQLYEQVLRPASLIALIGGAALLGIRLSAERALILTVIAAAVALTGIVIHFHRIAPSLRAHRHDLTDRADWIAVGWPLLLMNVVQEVLNQIDVIMLGHLADTAASGLYAAAWRLASLVPFALISLSFISAPMIATAYRRRDFDELSRIAKVNARLAFLFSLAMAAFLAAIGGFALRAFGDGFDAAYPALLILLGGGLISAFTGSVGYLMTMTGRQNSALLSACAALAANLVLNVTLISRLGIIGSAVAATSSVFVYNLLMWIHVRRTMGIDASVVARPPVPVADQRAP
ncbi:MAG TPA: oligosaccharide flippase family protein [Allosphingosinicella sp.]